MNTQQHPTPAPTNAWEALTQWLARVDWSVVFKYAARFAMALCVGLTFHELLGYFDVFGVAALPSLAQWLVITFFLIVSGATDSNNILLGLSALSIFATLAF